MIRWVLLEFCDKEEPMKRNAFNPKGVHRNEQTGRLAPLIIQRSRRPIETGAIAQVFSGLIIRSAYSDARRAGPSLSLYKRQIHVFLGRCKRTTGSGQAVQCEFIAAGAVVDTACKHGIDIIAWQNT